MVSVQSYADGGSEPSSGSVALALNEIVSPTLQGGSADVGLSIVTLGGRLATEHGPAGRPGEDAVRDLQADVDIATARVGPARGHAGGIVVLAVAVEVPCVGERIVVGIRRTAGVEGDVERGGAERRRGGEARDRRDVGPVVVDLPDLATVVVGVDEVAARRDRPGRRSRRRARCRVASGSRTGDAR